MAGYERRWVAEPVIGMPTTIVSTDSSMKPLTRTSTLPLQKPKLYPRASSVPPRKSTIRPMTSQTYSPLTAASYERQWVPGPQIGMPTTVVVEATVTPPPPSPEIPKPTRVFVPALPSNPRPGSMRRESGFIIDDNRPTRPALLSRATTSAARRPRRRDDSDEDERPRLTRATTGTTRRPRGRENFVSEDERPRLARSNTSASRRRRKDDESVSDDEPRRLKRSNTIAIRRRSRSNEDPEEDGPRRPFRSKSVAGRKPSLKSIIESPRFKQRLTDAPPKLPPLRIPSPESQKKNFEPSLSAPAERLKAIVFPNDVVLPKIAERNSESEWFESKKKAGTASDEVIPPMPKIIQTFETSISPRKQAQSQDEETPKASPRNVVFSLGDIAETTMRPPSDFEIPETAFQEPLYLPTVDIPASTRPSDTLSAKYGLEAASSMSNIVNLSPRGMTSTLLESLEAANFPTPPSSGDESSPTTPRTPVSPSRPAPLSLKTQQTASEPMFSELPLKTPTQPPKTSLPPFPVQVPALTSSLLSRSITSSKTSSPTITIRRKSSSAQIFTTTSGAPTSLTHHLMTLENSARRMYLATHAPFHLALSTGKKDSLELLSTYVSRERLYLQSSLRLISLLLANIILPSSPTACHLNTSTRLINLLIHALSRTQKTISLFSDIAEEYPDIDLEYREEKGAEMPALVMFQKIYTEIGMAVEKREKSVLAGLVLISGREKAHLQAFQELASTMSPGRSTTFTILNEHILPQFMSEDSIEFIEELEELIDLLWVDKYLAERSGADVDGRDPAKAGGEGKECMERRDVVLRKRGKVVRWEDEVVLLESLFGMVVDVQGRFWPDC